MNVLSKIKNKQFKKIGFLGLGKSNLSLMRLLPLGNTEIILRSETEFDSASIPQGLNISEVRVGNNALSGITEELMICSPSVRRDRAELLSAKERGICFSSDAELFFENCDKEVFAVTGSDGKSTTTTLLAKILSRRHKTAPVGNIGSPMLESLCGESEMFCAELSSFMLSYLNAHVRRAAITNITPNHLNWHKDLSEYIEAKLSLIKSSDESVLSADDAALEECLSTRGAFAVTSMRSSFDELKKRYKCHLYFTFNGDYILRNGELLVATSDIKKKEKHNIQNLMCAAALADGYCDSEDIRSVARTFEGLSHRAEFFLSHGGIDFINSSIDTTPSRTKSTLESLGRQVVLILCGRGKGASYEPLSVPLARYASHVVITGEDAEKMLGALAPYADCRYADGFDSAVELAIKLSSRGEAVLLSPAATSFDEFSSFEERGARFKSTVTKFLGENISSAER